MQKSLTALLADTVNDDNSGQIASQGFTFQEWYAVLLITELLEEPADFALGIEVKEDISVLDSPSTPTKVEFCQVKTNEQAVAWTLSELHKRGKKLKDGTFQPSILGKLYKRRREFDGYPTKLRFVSNSSFKIKDGESEVLNSHDYQLASLSDAGKKIVAKALANQLALTEGDINLQDVRLHRSDLSLGQQHLFISGKLSDLAHRQLIPFQVPQPVVAALMLASDVRSKGSNTSFAATFEELRSKRLIARSDAITTLSLLSNPSKSIAEIFDEGIELLRRDPEHDYGEVEELQDERAAVLLALTDRTDALTRNQLITLLDCYKVVKASNSPDKKKLRSYIERVANDAVTSNPEAFPLISKSLLRALTLMVIRNGIDINLFTTAANSQSEAAK
ncbi:dsDNA nuclease domain-containing protein [Pseudoduganella sp. R-31]|uniref:dsDNA nuclease domain-containing protein n=1 Tax=Pseudoduganella sp. R-31 TaxID=3404060 RepID=UPI003CE940F3